MARDLLSVQASSTESERMFSLCGRTMTKTRSKLGAGKLTKNHFFEQLDHYSSRLKPAEAAAQLQEDFQADTLSRLESPKIFLA